MLGTTVGNIVSICDARLGAAVGFSDGGYSNVVGVADEGTALEVVVGNVDGNEVDG